MNTSNLYESDFYAWTQEQASLLNKGEWHKLDVANLIEEMQSLGKQERQELRNRLSVLIAHLLKWEYQSKRRSRSWLTTIGVQRVEIATLLEDNPSLKPYLEEALQKAYQKSVALAAIETQLSKSTFPGECPYTRPMSESPC